MAETGDSMGILAPFDSGGLILVIKTDKQTENLNQRWLLVFLTNKDPDTQKVKKNTGFNRATHNMRTFSGETPFSRNRHKTDKQW